MNSKKRCKHCKEYRPADSMLRVPAGTFCSIEHASAWAKQKSEADNKRKAAAKTKLDKERIKSISTLCSEAQSDVNAMIRAADIALGYSCIATGAPISDAGHFYHAGTKYRVSWLRFFHANIHGQGAQSNRYAGGGDALNYVNGLLNRYGQSYLDDLNEFKRMTDSGDMPAPTREEIEGMRRWCRAMTRLYKKNAK